MSNRLHICQTCERDGALAENGSSRGQRLTEQVLELLADSGLADQLTIRKVPCLSGCLNPCNVAFRASGKSSLRFGRLDESLAADVVAFASYYIASNDGDVDKSLWPEALQDRMTARTPAPGAAAASKA